MSLSPPWPSVSCCSISSAVHFVSIDLLFLGVHRVSNGLSPCRLVSLRPRPRPPQSIRLAVRPSARGKTHISRALERYLRWMGVKTRVYSLGDYRRKVLGGAKNVPKDYYQNTGK